MGELLKTEMASFSNGKNACVFDGGKVLCSFCWDFTWDILVNEVTHIIIVIYTKLLSFFAPYDTVCMWRTSGLKLYSDGIVQQFHSWFQKNTFSL